MIGRHILPNILSDFNFSEFNFSYLYLNTLTLRFVGCYENQSLGRLMRQYLFHSVVLQKLP